MTLLDAFNRWLSTGSNEQQAKSAVSGRKTAVTLAAAALGGSPAEVTLSALNAFDDSALTDLLRTGARNLNRRPPSQKTLANYRSYLRGILSYGSEGRTGNLALLANKTAVFSKRPRLGSFKDLPAGIRQVINEVIEWKAPGTLPRREERYRSGTWGEGTAERNRKELARYAHRLRLILGIDDLTIFDLVNRDHFIAWRQWEEAYLRNVEPESGRRPMQGYASARKLAVCLAVIAGQYLLAKAPDWLRQEAEDAEDEPLREFFYRKARQLRDEHAGRPESHTLRDVRHLTPQDFWDVGMREFYAIRTSPPRGTMALIQAHVRKRTAFSYIMTSVTPLRTINLRGMRWEQNLRRLSDGRWEVRFQSDELKVPTRGGAPNEYRHVYRPELSKVIDDYVIWLKRSYGDDIQQRAPFVFSADPTSPEYNASRPMSYTSFANAYVGLWLNVRGERITVHRIRAVVATHLIAWGIANGKDGIALAAHALGDTVKTIIATYYKPNIDAFALYESSLSSK